MYQVTIKNLSVPYDPQIDYIIHSDSKFEDNEFNTVFEKMIEIYEKAKNRSLRCQTAHDRSEYDRYHENHTIREIKSSNNQLVEGLPNIRFSCYLNSVIQALRIVFDQLSITINNTLTYSKSISQIISSLNDNNGVYLQDYHNFLDLLRLESWARGDPRDAKEFFTFILAKLKSEGNNSLNQLFTTKIIKNHHLSCSKTCESKILQFDDSVTIINGTSANLQDCINKKIKNKSIIKDYPCDSCNRTEDCYEIIEPTSTARVFVVYINPQLNIPINSILNSRNFICAISFTVGAINHFKTYTLKTIYDDSTEIKTNYRSSTFSYFDNFSRNASMDLAYMVFIKAGF